MKLRELMTPEVRTCSPQDSVVEAAKLMASIDVGIIPVIDGKRLIGVVTDRDIVLSVVAKGQDNRSTTVEQAMSRDLVTGSPEMDAHEAAKLMAQKQIRRLPIVENGELVGIVAIGDLATIQIHEDEAGRALSEISEPSRPELH